MLRCPHCEETKFDGDWMYEAGLFNPEVTVEVRCPTCKEKFYVQTYESIDYECFENEDEI